MSRPVRDYRTSSMASWKTFLKENPNDKITWEQWKKLLTIYGGIVWLDLMETGATFPIPYGNGRLYIRKKKFATYVDEPNGKRKLALLIDWGATNKLWKNSPEAKEKKKLVRHLNAHSDGYRFKFFWSKYNSFVPMKDLWQLRACRAADRELKQFIMKGPLYQGLYQENKYGY